MLIFALPLALWAAFPVFARAHAEPIYRQFTREVRVAQSLGIPLTASDLKPTPPIPDEQNGAPILRAIFATSQEQREARGQLIVELDRSTPSQKITLPPDVDAALDAAKLIRSKGGLDFKRDYSQGLALLYPELGELKQLTQLLCRRAVLRARLGDAKLAIDDLTTAMHLAKIRRTERSFLDVIANLALDAIIISGYLDVAAALRGKEDQLDSLKQTFDPPEIPNLRDIVAFEIGAAFNAIRVEANQRSLDPAAEMPVVHTFAANEILRHGKRCLNLLDQGLPDPHFIGLALDSEEYEIGRFVFKGTDMTIEALIPRYGELGAALMKQETRRSFVRASIDILIFESRTGKLPTSLDELGNVFLDSFASRSVSYRVTERGFRLWSVGIDRVDNGGLRADEINPASGSPEPLGDIVEEFPRPPRKRNEPAAGLPSK
jgi:hypothetical protein